MASLQSDLAADQLSGECPGAKVKLNRRSLGGLAFDIQFESDEAADAAAAASSPSRKARCPTAPPAALGGGSNNNSSGGGGSQLSADEIAERLAAAEERRLGHMEEVKQRARGQSAGAKDRRDVVREQQEAARQLLEAELERDIREKEARRREQLEKIVHDAQQHLAKVETARAHRVSGGGVEVAEETKID